jgi:hypothetical protein
MLRECDNLKVDNPTVYATSSKEHARDTDLREYFLKTDKPRKDTYKNSPELRVHEVEHDCATCLRVGMSDRGI